MARTPMITRNVTSTEVTVMTLDVNKGEPYITTYILPRTYKDEAKLLKFLREKFDTEDIKVVHIVDKKEVVSLRGMSEDDFMEYSIELDPVTRKPIEK